MSVWGVSAVAILDSSVNCVCVWSTKKLTMLAYCVATSCNNSQMTPGITMPKLLCNQPAVRQKWIKFIQFKRADFLNLLRCITPFCVVSTSVSVISQTPWNTGTLSKSCLKLIQLYPCGSLRQSISFIFGAWVGPFCSDSPEWCSRHMVTWFGHHGDTFGTTENAFFRAFITLKSQFHLHHCSQWALTEIVSKITPNLGLVL